MESSTLHSAGATARRFTVIVSTYNRARYLHSCLRHLSQMRYPCFEILVVNGPSVDESEKVLDEFPGVRRLRTASRNISVSRNVGLRQAAGELVAFLDDDAEPPPDWLASLAACFDAPDVGGAGGPVALAGGQVEFANGTINLNGLVRPVAPRPAQFWDPNGRRFNTVMGTNCAFRLKALEEIGFFDEAFEYYHDEADVCVRLIRRGWRVVHGTTAVRHLAAPGPHRVRRLEINWNPVLKSTVYYALKHQRATGAKKWSAVVVICLSRLLEITRWLLSGKIGPVLYLRSIQRGWSGVRDGLRLVKNAHERRPQSA